MEHVIVCSGSNAGIDFGEANFLLRVYGAFFDILCGYLEVPCLMRVREIDTIKVLIQRYHVN